MWNNSIRILRIALVVGTFWAAVAFGEGSPSAGREAPDAMPAVKILWSLPGSTALVDGEDLFVAGEATLHKVDPSTGAALWSCPFPFTSECCGPMLLALEGSVAVAEDQELLVVDRESSKKRFHRHFERRIIDLLGPPLVVTVSGGMRNREVIALDPATGETRATWEPPDGIGWFFIEDDVVVSQISNSDEHGDLVTALSGDDLQPLWTLTLDRYGSVRRVDGALMVRSPGERESGDTFRFLDVHTGILEDTLPQRKESNLFAIGDVSWELQEANRDDDWITIRRNSRQDGTTLWAADIEGGRLAFVRRRDDVIVHSTPDAGPGLLVVLDWTSGNVLRHAEGLDDSVDRLFATGDAIVASTENDGIFGLHPEELAPPGANSLAVDGQVQRILARVDSTMGDEIRRAAADILNLGPTALPAVTDVIADLDFPALAAAAQVVEASIHVQAAPALSGRLDEMELDAAMMRFSPSEGSGYDSKVAALAILEALAVVGGDNDVSSVRRVMEAGEAVADLRLRALVTLVSIGTESSINSVLSLIEGVPEPVRLWFRPPDPADLLTIMEEEVTDERIDTAAASGKWNEYSLLQRAMFSLIDKTADGRRYLVFPDTRMGGEFDMWIAELDEQRRPKPSVLLGIGLHRNHVVGPHDSIQGQDVVSLWRADRPDAVRRVRVSDVMRDTDGDGLTDVVENRIRTDPRLSDTDGDGVHDAFDLAPNASVAKPRTESEAIALAIFEQMNMFCHGDEDSWSLTIVTGDAALPWRGRCGPTITLSKAERDSFISEAGLDGVPHISISPVESGEKDMFGGLTHSAVELEAGDRLFRYSEFRGGLNAAWYLIVVRQIDGHWLVGKMILEGVS